jgi:uncharacterized protein YegL
VIIKISVIKKVKVMIKNKKTYYLLILDKSGSMGSVISKTIEGFNEQVQMIKSLQQKYPEQEILVSLTTFNHNVDHNMFLKRTDQLRELQTHQNNMDCIIYRPNGLTALYDAIGMSVKNLKKKIKKEIKNNEATAVVVILTDGYENASKEYSYDDIRRLIGKLEKSENWTFSYMGATLDAVEIATGLNIEKHNAIRFVNENIKEQYDVLNKEMDFYLAKKRLGFKSKQFFSANNH